MAEQESLPRWEIVDFNTLPGTPCPCGTARRALADVADFPGTLHVTEIDQTARTHYHRRLTETYFVLDCQEDAVLELDEQTVALRPGIAVLIRPGVRHRAVGHMRVMIVCVPNFDPADEWFD